MSFCILQDLMNGIVFFLAIPKLDTYSVLGQGDIWGLREACDWHIELSCMAYRLFSLQKFNSLLLFLATSTHLNSNASTSFFPSSLTTLT